MFILLYFFCMQLYSKVTQACPAAVISSCSPEREWERERRWEPLWSQELSCFRTSNYCSLRCVYTMAKSTRTALLWMCVWHIWQFHCRSNTASWLLCAHWLFLSHFLLSLNNGMVIKEWNMETEIDDWKGNVGREREGDAIVLHPVLVILSIWPSLGSLKGDEGQI